jgi:hypothetical protein
MIIGNQNLIKKVSMAVAIITILSMVGWLFLPLL